MYQDLAGDVTHLDGVEMQISGHGLGYIGIHGAWEEVKCDLKGVETLIYVPGWKCDANIGASVEVKWDTNPWTLFEVRLDLDGTE